jgi:hypothetical protein
VFRCLYDFVFCVFVVVCVCVYMFVFCVEETNIYFFC